MSFGVYLRGAAVVTFFMATSVATFISMLIGSPLYLFNKDVYRAWLNLQERNWAAGLVYVTGRASPVTAKIYVEDPALRTKFVVDEKTHHIHSRLDPRAVVTSNHQLYNDWAYLWWLSYTSNLHGAIIIMLKQSIRSVPMFGLAMYLWRFVFLRRDWKQDEKTITTAMQELSEDKQWPVWLVIFPEGTVVNPKMLGRSRAFYELPTTPKKYPHPRNMLLPRATGLYAVLKNLRGSVKVMYDITTYFPGIPADSCGEVTFSLQRTYAEGKGPREMRMHIREFVLDSIPLDDPKEFADWLYKVYDEKDHIFDKLRESSPELGEPLVGKLGIESPLELYGAYNVPLTVAILARLVWKWLRS